MDLGMVTAIAMGAAVHFVYGDKGRVAAASAVITGAALYAAYYCKLRANPKLTEYMMGGKNNGSGNGQSIELNGWKPLIAQDIQYVRDTIENSNGISFISEP